MGCAWHTDTEDDKKLQGKVDKLRDALRDIASDDRGKRIVKSIGIAVVNEFLIPKGRIMKVAEHGDIQTIDLCSKEISDVVLSLFDN